MSYTLKYSWVLVLVVFLQCHLKSWGQEHPVFKTIDYSNGLSNARVTSIVKNPNGFVWIGTKNGLNRYDGSEIKVFNKHTSKIGANDIADLFIDAHGNLWIATLGGGLSIYDPQQDRFTVYKNDPADPGSIPSNQVKKIFRDSKGTIWLGTESGLSRFSTEKRKFKTYAHSHAKNSLSNNSVNSIYEDKAGNLWIGSFGGGIDKFDPGSGLFEHIGQENQKSSSFIHSIYPLNDHEILIGTSDKGLLALNINTLQFTDFFKDRLKLDQKVTIVRSITSDKKGNIWVGTDGNGIFKILHPNDPRLIGFQNYRYNSNLQTSLSGNAIYEITEDEDANIWIGTAWNGVNVLNQESNHELLYSDIKGQNPSPVLSVQKSGDKLFFGLDGRGLTVYEPKTNTVSYFNKEHNSAIGGEYIQYIIEGSKGFYWLGTFSNGLIKFDAKTGDFKKYDHQAGIGTSLSYNDVRYIIEDEKQGLWIATWGGGLNYFDHQKKEFKRFRENEADPTGIGSNNIISLQKDGDKLWMATFGGGLEMLDLTTGKFTLFKHQEDNPNSPSSNNIFSILKDSRGNLWLGTSGEGINTFNPRTKIFNRFGDRENIRYTTVTAIIEDDNGMIWFSTKQGIFNYNYTTDRFNKFPELSGEFHINAVLKDKNLLYFGGINGVLRFDPDRMEFDEKRPEVVLTNFKLFNKELPVGNGKILDRAIPYEKQITLKHDMDVMTFEFAALEFPFSSDCEYAVKMENFDKAWRNIGQESTTTFTNLSPGAYTFKVKARKEGQEWGRDYTALKVVILKPFWLEWWALVIYGLLIIGLFYLFQKYIVRWEKMKSHLKLEQLTHEKDTELYTLKQQFFTNISHEIRTPVTLLLGAINRLVEKSSFVEKKETTPLTTIQKHGNHLLQLVNELLDFRNLELERIKLKVIEEDWVSFCKEIFLSFNENAQHKNIEYSFETAAGEINLYFDPAQMEKVLYNLLSNALKFTPEGGSITVELVEMDQEVVLKVQDTGIGIGKKQRDKIFQRFYQSKKPKDFDAPGFGLGLSISKEIVDLHDGTIRVESKKGEGSTFILKLKKGSGHFDSLQIIENRLKDKDYLKKRPGDGIKEKDIDTDLSELKDETVLIVEDNEEVRRYIAQLLEKSCTLMEAENGKEGLEIIAKNQPDLIISDIMMPVMDGVRFTRQVKTNPETSHIPVILLTARATTVQQMEGYETGADAYITKPFSEEILKIRIKNLLKNRNLLRDKFKSEKSILPADLDINSLDEQFLEKLIAVIQDNIDTDALNAEFIAKEIGMSHSVIYKKVKSLTGMTFVEFVRDFKLKIARELISEKGYSVAEASFKVGYSDRKYFSKLFKEKFGKNPSAYSK